MNCHKCNSTNTAHSIANIDGTLIAWVCHACGAGGFERYCIYHERGVNT